MARAKHSDARTLVPLIIVSFAVHIAFILLVPAFIMSPSPPEYIEVDVLEIGTSPADGNMEDVEIYAPRIPEETTPVIETGLSSLEWDAFAPPSASDLQEFDWQARAKFEPVAPDAMPRADNLLAQVALEKEPPDIAGDDSKGVSLIDDAVTAVAPPPHSQQADEQTSEIVSESDVAAPSESASLPLQEPKPPVSAMRRIRRDLPAERLDMERETFALPAREKTGVMPVQLPETKSVPEGEYRELFQAEVPASMSVSLSESSPAQQEDIPTLDHSALPTPSTSLETPMMTARVERATLPELPTRERSADRVVRPTLQAEPSNRKVTPVEQTSEIVLPIPTVTRNVQEAPATEDAGEFLPPQPLAIHPRISADDERIAAIREIPAARRSRQTDQVNARLQTRVEPAPRERAMAAPSSVPDGAVAKALPQESDEIEPVVHEETAREESIRIEGPASARTVSYRPARLPSVTLDRDVTIRLKFWVLPDGSVGDVVPLQRGDVRLEQAAIQYVKSWRFTPVSGSETVWGIIPVKYRLQ